MAYENTVGILIAAKNEAAPVFAEVVAQSKAASESIATASKTAAAASESSLKSVGKNLGETGSMLTRSLTLPIVALAAVSGDLAYKFNNAMELLHTSAGIPQSAISSLSDKVLTLAGTTGQAPEALAKGLYHVASAGNGIWNTSQQLDILTTAAKGANLGLASLDDTTYALTSAMASGIKGAGDPTSMMGVLSAIVGAGDMKMNDLNGALSTGILSTAATYGISIQSIGSALATLTDNGEHADEAATRLRMSIALMSSPSSMATKQLEALGLTAENAKKSTEGMNAVFAKSGLATTKLADDLRQPNGIGVAIKDLKTHLEAAGLSASETDAMLAKAFGGGRTDAALLTLLQNTDRIDAKFTAINGDAGNMQIKLNDLNETPNQKLREAWSSMQASLIRIGGDLLPVAASLLTTVAHDVEGISKWWTSLDGTQRTALGWLIGVLAVGGPILMGTGAIIKDVQLIGTTFNSVIGLIGKGGIMGGIATAGAMADIALVLKAIQSVQSAMDALNSLKDAKAGLQTVTDQINAAAKTAYNSGNTTKGDALSKIGRQSQSDVNKVDTSVMGNLAGWWNSLSTFATGTSFAPGGLSMVHKDELIDLPTGSKVHTAKETKDLMSGGGSLNIANLHIHNNMDEQRFLAKLGWKLALT
jgi:hypothetical protein